VWIDFRALFISGKNSIMLSTSYRHLEPERLGPNFVWAVKYAQVIYHTKVLSLFLPIPRDSYIGNTGHGIGGTFVL